MPLIIRPYTVADLDQLIRIQRECFPPPFPSELWWRADQIACHTALFPEGALAVDSDGELVASATAHIIRFDPAHPDHTWADIADHGYLRNHDPDGDTLYGVDMAVRPAWRGHGIAKALYRARFALVQRRGLVRFLAGSRISGYHLHRHDLDPQAYVDAVIAGRLSDPVITPQLKAGLEAVHLVHGYVDDADSADCALLMQWRNPGLG